MAHQRTPSMGDPLKSPHSVSLKVLRLSRPSLAHQYPLPSSEPLGISPKASLAYPSEKTNDLFILSPVLNLPEAFGSAYIGETFSCTLCANNELLPSDNTRIISGVRIAADMQTPSTSSGFPLDLARPMHTGDEDQEQEEQEQASPGPGESLQNILRFELKEEGNHVLAVTVTYTETTLAGEGKAASGRVRTFRKLYQFVAQQLLSVRTKIGGVRGRGGREKFVLEAQLENMGEAGVCLETVGVTPKPPFKATSLNWDQQTLGLGSINSPILNPRDVIQIAFLLEQQVESEAPTDPLGKITSSDSKKILGQLVIQWRTALGDRGSLSTGWLTSRR
ncbi:hypothetical protein GQ43DRAFT_435748 [Delitschia confertaspora ATCC 74209]|uniref:DUF974 domain protein n=1 Tax=Delitschia confertaspora ATCC 74209 TaxID=1513339 RepID=A0A9P4JHE5_9PLEO|nr:hypothetical protein GQ43DRAFT_435748 [Delitschia confertaspora ATCC 74209]